MSQLPHDQTGVRTEMALVFHKVNLETSLLGPTRTGLPVVTRHDIVESSQGPEIGPGRLLSQADKAALLELLRPDGTRFGWLPGNLLHLSPDGMAWYHPPKQRPMFFLASGKTFRRDLIWPGLVFCYSHHRGFRLAVYAGKGRPSQRRRLYHAPLWNVYQDCSLCAGSAETADEISPESMAVWDAAVFDSRFSHRNHEHVIRLPGKKAVSNSAYLRFVRKKARSGKGFLASEMMPLGVSLGGWLSGQFD